VGGEEGVFRWDLINEYECYDCYWNCIFFWAFQMVQSFGNIVMSGIFQVTRATRSGKFVFEMM